MPNSEQAEDAFAELIDMLNGSWRFARCQSCGALAELGPLAAPAVPDLIRAVASGDPFVEQEAMRALASIGPAAEPAMDLFIETIESALPDLYGLTVLYALEGVANVGTPGLRAIPILERAVKSDNPALAREAALALQNLNGNIARER